MCPMADDRPALPTSEPPSPVVGPVLTRGEFVAFAVELEALRGRHKTELAARLRDARAHGSPGDNEDVLAVHEDVSVLGARIARLEELLRAAPVVDHVFDGGASLGCTVRVTGAGGRVAEYVLVGRRSDSPSLREVSSGSPVGQALLGGRPGEIVRVQLPDGRDRELRIVAVTPPPATSSETAAAAFGVKAA